eukprot:GDKI01040301.1.p2 GENE.GDKI01040301.1~~GDKI01040301.1.p2  ORF type:complete len:118 (-),score=32.19 GDKI01040301.1:287-640(-)
MSVAQADAASGVAAAQTQLVILRAYFGLPRVLPPAEGVMDVTDRVRSWVMGDRLEYDARPRANVLSQVFGDPGAGKLLTILFRVGERLYEEQLMVWDNDHVVIEIQQGEVDPTQLPV